MWPSSITEKITRYSQLEASALFDTISPLISNAIIQVKGEEAAKFLQGQLSCDVNLVSNSHFSLGTHNTAKGRMISSFRIFCPEANCYWLLLDRALADTALKALQKYIVFSKADICLRDDLLAYTVQGQSIQTLQLDSPTIEAIEQQVTNAFGLVAQVSTAAQAKTLLIIEPEDVALKRLSSHETAIYSDENALLNLEYEQGLAFVTLATSDSFIAQMLNYQYSSAINFKKGCYTGQEIVARTHYKGKVKRKLYQLSIDCEPKQSINIGDELFIKPVDSSKTKSVATVASITTNNESSTMLKLLAVAAPEIENFQTLSNESEQVFTVKNCQAAFDETTVET